MSSPDRRRDRFEWNPHAAQPKVVMSEPRRILESARDVGSHVRFAGDCLRLLPGVSRHYRRLKATLFAPQRSILGPDSLGMGVSAVPGGHRTVVEGLQDLGLAAALVRVPYRSGDGAPFSEPEAHAQHELIERLLAEGFDVTVAIPQDRQAVSDPARWAAGLAEILERYRGRCNSFQIGQAINRRKWGLWTVDDYLALLEPAFEARDRHPEIELVGPPVLDFEFHYHLAVLGALDRSQRRLDRFSSQLYVDRQGAPESERWGWSLIEKCTALAAMGAAADYSRDDVWITEVNWPLRDQGEYAPAHGYVAVDEDQYADFMVRYLVLALTSGTVGRVYWWQLVARGYGLIDDTGSVPRRRPAFVALETMVDQLRGARFLGRAPHPSAVVLRFAHDASEMIVGWALPTAGPLPVTLDLDRGVESATGRDGRPLAPQRGAVRLTASPTYLRFPA